MKAQPLSSVDNADAKNKTKDLSATIHPKTSLYGRSFKAVLKSAGAVCVKIAKIALTAGLILSLIALPTAAALTLSPQCSNGQCSPNVATSAVSEWLAPQCTSSSSIFASSSTGQAQVAELSNRHFPAYTARFMNTGMQLVFEGTAGCVLLNDTIMPVEQCQTAVTKAMLSPAFLNAPKVPQFAFEIGLAIAAEEDDGHVSSVTCVEISPQKYQNYKEAEHFIEEAILSSDVLFSGSVDDTVNTIKKIHEILLQKLPRAAEDAGKYRTMLDYINHGNPKQHHAKKLATLSPSEMQIYQAALPKLDKHDLRLFTPKELSVMQKVYTFCTNPNDIRAEMENLAKNLIDKIARKVDPKYIAGWLHMEIVRIHPFGDANGRLARILLNTILVHYKQTPAVFHDTEAYNRAVKDGIRSLPNFIKYLRSEVLPWTKNHLHERG